MKMSIEIEKDYWVEILNWFQNSESVLNTMTTNERIAFDELGDTIEQELEDYY